MNRHFIVFTGLGLFLIAGLAATRPPAIAIPTKEVTGSEHRYKNLKVLPKDIDEESMDQLMENYARSIGVGCMYCHVKTKPGITPERMDFPSDENPKKAIARDMLRLTAKINKKYFHYSVRYDYTSFTKAPVACRTCHRGYRIPVIKDPYSHPAGSK